MTKELEKSLRDRYPEILEDMYGDPKKTCMAWGIECDDGWYNLLDSTLSKINLASSAFLSHKIKIKFKATQIKEKFGTLSFYYDISSSSKLASEIIADLVSHAERASSAICEVTGKYGVKCSRSGWIKTLCREKAMEMSYSPTKPEVAEYWASQA